MLVSYLVVRGMWVFCMCCGVEKKASSAAIGSGWRGRLFVRLSQYVTVYHESGNGLRQTSSGRLATGCVLDACGKWWIVDRSVGGTWAAV